MKKALKIKVNVGRLVAEAIADRYVLQTSMHVHRFETRKSTVEKEKKKARMKADKRALSRMTFNRQEVFHKPHSRYTSIFTFYR